MNKIPNPFRKPTLQEVIQRQMDEAELTLLDHEAAASYHTKMAEACRDTIMRLKTKALLTA